MKSYYNFPSAVEKRIESIIVNLYSYVNFEFRQVPISAIPIDIITRNETRARARSQMDIHGNQQWPLTRPQFPDCYRDDKAHRQQNQCQVISPDGGPRPLHPPNFQRGLSSQIARRHTGSHALMILLIVQSTPPPPPQSVRAELLYIPRPINRPK